MPAEHPHDIDVEQAFLGAVIWNNEVVDIVDGKLAEADFFEPVHARLWSVFMEARRAGRVIDARLTAAALGSDAQVEIVRGMSVSQYVARLAAGAITVAGAKDYAASIR